MLCLGITGGIGSGKSYVSRIFTALGIPVYEADTQTKLLYGRDEKLKQALTSLLGADIFKDGRLQKEVMAAKIFSDRGLLEQVNRLVHPVVIGDFTDWKVRQDAPYVVMESAIILETPFASAVDKMLTVSSPAALRLERIHGRDKTGIEDAQRRMDKQWSDAMREAKSDFVVYSDGKIPLLPQVLRVHQEMITLNMYI
ncbi:MAG: dephospho-CoA kinase [Bacteroidales bacterium]|nr:dephospho-CoA kinase [Bacteroidales bacterium]MCL2738952.1 dephospho-CoA kinase [Bacteroidales bacterium]